MTIVLTAEQICEVMKMAEYLEHEKVLDDSNIITVQTREYGSIEVIPVDTITDIELADVQPVKRGRWIEKSEEYYRLWQDSGRSWDDMPYFVTGLKFACSCCFKQYDVNAEGVEEWDFCPKCGADMRGDENV